MSGEDILLERRGAIALVTMNRPKALNTLTLPMYRALEPKLRAWEKDPAVRAVVIRGAGGKAFCAGGDVRALWETGRGLGGPDDPKRVFFREEYWIIRRVHRLPKPYVALMNGITMGGGAGMSINGRWRVSTDNTMFAMPETAIGLFPDVGATHFLGRCPGKIGLYLALTGERLKAADLVYCGLATHYVPQDRLDALTEALAGGADVEATLKDFARDPGPSKLAPLREAIDRCFGGKSVEAILEALERESGAWAEATRATLLRMSPTSLKITFRQLQIGAPEIEDALRLEYRMTQHCMEEYDFFEGVRAVLVDKDQTPKWVPSDLAEVTHDFVERHFASIGENELDFPD